MRSPLRAALVVAATAFALLTACSGQSAGPPPQPTSAATTPAQYAQAWSSASAVDLPTSVGAVSDEKGAYTFARQYADDLPVAGQRYGFKFGCGSASLCPFAQQVPLFGILWAPMRQAPGATIDRSTYVRGFVEGELAFRFARDVTQPLATTRAVKRVATQVAPAIELPDFAFGDLPLDQTPNVDVAALNGIARNLVVGSFLPTSDVDVDAVRMTGTLDGSQVLAGSAQGVTDGSHWEALQLAVELILEQGETVRAGDVIISGTMGEPTPLAPGEYRVSYGRPLGSIGFTAE